MVSKKKAAGATAAPKKVKWPFPRATLQKALSIPLSLKEHNGGNPWDTDEVRNAVSASKGGNAWFYLTAASRDYGLTTGTRDTQKIALEELGREIVYAPNPETEMASKKQAFLRIEINGYPSHSGYPKGLWSSEAEVWPEATISR